MEQISSGGRMKLLRFTIMVFLIFTAALAFAQQTGTITGKVLDNENQPVQGATVELVGTQINAAANDAGEYTLSNVPAGNYTIRASTYSYKAQTSQVTVSAGQSVTQDFTMTLDL